MIRNRLGASARGTPRVPPAGGVITQAAAFYQATATNTVSSAATPNLLAVATAAYNEDFASPAWTFAAAGCTATYAGEVGRRFLVTSTYTLIPESEPGSFVGFWGAIALNGDVLGLLPSATFAGGVQQFVDVTDSIPKSFSCQRLVQPSVGDVVQPSFALFEAVDLTIRRHTVSIVEV